MRAGQRRRMWVLGAVLLGLAPSGCGKDDEDPYEALFSTTTASPNKESVFGIWGNKLIVDGGQLTIESRLRLRATEVTVSTRCTRSSDGATATAGVTARATVTESTISVAEAKEDVRKLGPEGANQGECSAVTTVFEDPLVIEDGQLRIGSGTAFEKFAD